MKKRIPLATACRLGALFALLFGTAALAASPSELYSWTDEDGVVHFSDTRPMHTESRIIEVNEAGQTSPPPVSEPAPLPESGADDGAAPDLSAAEATRQDLAETREAQREEQAQTDRMCERHQRRLEQMEPARRVYYTDDNGQEVRMDDVERVALIEESRDFLARNCH